MKSRHCAQSELPLLLSFSRSGYLYTYLQELDGLPSQK